MDVQDASAAVARMPTGIAGLDVVLAGGLLRGSINVLSGLPGTGKTMLASQMAYALAARGETAIYASLMSESHTRLITNLRSVSFFDASLLGTRVQYISAAPLLEEPQGMNELLRVVSREVRSRSASLLVLDSTGSIAELAPAKIAYRKFLRDLAASAALAGCTVLLLVPGRCDSDAVEPYVADCVIELHQCERGLRSTRELAVSKFRGSEMLSGRHVFQLDRHGAQVHPRLETLPLFQTQADQGSACRSAFDVAGLDDMLEGGVGSDSMTGLVGAPGSGKTLLGLQFLKSGLQRGEPAVYFGTYETTARVLAKARGVGISLDESARSGALRLLWMAPTEQSLDGMAHSLLEEISAARATRIFVDGADGLLQSASHPERFTTFFSALGNQLRARGVASMVSMESQRPEVETALAHVALSAAVDNVVLLRYVERRGQLHRLLSILKVRESAYDPFVREFHIDSEGLHVTQTFGGTDGPSHDPGAASVLASAPAGGRSSGSGGEL